MKEFVSAVEDLENEDDDEESFIEFKLDGRVMRAYHPNEGQLIFMMAAMGRGQSQDQRFASIMNIMLSSLRDADADYLEGRMLSRGKDRLPTKKIEEIFEHLSEEWFARPTQPPSGSASSPPKGGQKSKRPTTKSIS